MISTGRARRGRSAEGQTDSRVKWLGQPIMRRHSFYAVARQIARHQRLNDVTRISLQGVEGSGKTTLAKLLAHQIHIDMSTIAVEKGLPPQTRAALSSAYSVHFFGDEELVDFEATLAALPRNNRVIVFDDVSFLRGGNVSRQQLEHLKKAMTVIRHLEGGTDVRTVIIMNYHYSKSMDVYLRDTHFRVWTSLLPEELKNAQKMLPSAKHRAVAGRFQRFYAAMSQGKHVKITDTDAGGKKTTVTYKYNDPFRLALFTDNNSLRMFVYPDADRMVGKCGVCRPSEQLADPALVLKFLGERIGRNNLVAGLKIMAMQRYGVPIHRLGIRQAVCMLDRLYRNGAINDDWLVAAMRTFSKPMGSMQQKPYPNLFPIPTSVRKEFLKLTGTDGLRAVNATEQSLDHELDQKMAEAK